MRGTFVRAAGWLLAAALVVVSTGCEDGSSGVQASPAPLLFRQRGLSVWKHDSPIKPYTKGILFSARLY